MSHTHQSWAPIGPHAHAIAVLGFLALSSLVASCSAVVSPDLARLGGDGGPSGDDAPGLACGTGQIGCGGTCVDPSTDERACGGCGRACAPGQTCTAGTCVCAPGGMCVDVPDIGDPAACGATRAVCATGQLCLRGSCVCRPGLELVGAECVDLRSDPSHCGMPGMRCAAACRGGVCVEACGEALRNCDGACVDFRRDPLNCGECGRACDGDEACVAGDCRGIRSTPGCTTCPCPVCSGTCCTLPRLMIPYCVNADVCP